MSSRLIYIESAQTLNAARALVTRFCVHFFAFQILTVKTMPATVPPSATPVGVLSSGRGRATGAIDAANEW